LKLDQDDPHVRFKYCPPDASEKWADTKRNPASETDGDALLSADTASPPLAPSADDGAALRAPDGGDSDASAVTAAPPRSKRKVIFASLGAIALATAAWFAYDYVTVGQYIVSTEDAYVGADMAILSPKVSAHVADVPVVENQSVKEGDVLVRLDDGDYRLAVSQAEAKLATQTAAIATFDAQIRAAEATAQQARRPSPRPKPISAGQSRWSTATTLPRPRSMRPSLRATRRGRKSKPAKPQSKPPTPMSRC
jgi:membrane fusion protein (multidrug efflux system)